MRDDKDELEEKRKIAAAATRLDLKDYVAIIVAALETTLLPFLVVAALLLLLAVLFSL